MHNMSNDFQDVREMLARAEALAKEEANIEGQLSAIAKQAKELELRRDDLECDDDLRKGIADQLIEIGKSVDRPEAAAAAEYSSLVRRFAALWPAAMDPDSQHFVEALFDQVTTA
jgi:hypothetical protein